MKRFLILFSIIIVSATMMIAQPPRRGVPATREPIEYVQPNGDTLVFRLFGDERYHYRTTLDGYLIKQNKKGYYCYAKYNSKGEVVCTHRKAHNEAERSRCEKRYLQKHIPNKLEGRQLNETEE